MRLFNRITLLTPESVELEFTLAGIGSRALALLIDYHIVAFTLIALWLLLALIAGQLLGYLDTLGSNYADLPIWLLAIAILITFVIATGYFVFFEVTWQGQTIGKRFAKIRVIRDDGRPVGLSQAALRALLRPIDDILFIGAFLILLGQKEKRIGDWVAGTLVVQEVRPVVKAAIAVSQEAEKLAAELPQITDLSKLLPDDFAVIREYLQRRNFMERNAKSELSLQLARQARNLINLETIPAGLTSDEFLEAVYLAYQQQERGIRDEG
ncbi:RDD family protein [Cyanobacteria bacterium FACHB-471]|nr:RDD family protein [Cyanobacteria bacterium FACHB-471]